MTSEELFPALTDRMRRERETKPAQLPTVVITRKNLVELLKQLTTEDPLKTGPSENLDSKVL